MIVLDLSSRMRWSGSPVGIMRVESEFAHWTRNHHRNAVFACFDSADLVFRQIRPEWVTPILCGEAVVWEVRDRRDGERSRRFSIAHVRRRLRRLRRARRTAVLALETLRLSQRSSAIRLSIELLQSIVMGQRHRRELVGAGGKRKSLLTWNRAVGSEIALDTGSIVVETGLPWWHLDIDALRESKREAGFKYVVLCHDIIPLQFPEFLPARHVAQFRSYYDAAFPLIDLAIFTTRTVERDVRAYCTERGLKLGKSAVVPLGSDPFRGQVSGELPAGLKAGRYALFVGTIEPRKGHAFLLKIWSRLLADEIPQKADFRLVFVGRQGWMVDGLVRELRDRRRTHGTIVMLDGTSDGALDMLYAKAAFCLMPSIYEGYGLPIVEAFSHGKAVIASTGGAIPEVVNGLSPCIDLTDENTWYETMRDWIIGSGSRSDFEMEIRSRFRHPTWDESASLFFQVIEEQLRDF